MARAIRTIGANTSRRASDSVTLDLDPYETQALIDLLRRVGGLPRCRRGLMDRVLEALMETGVSAVFDEADLSGHVEFECEEG